MADYNSGLHAVQVFVDELYQAGVRQVCVAPGSRSTPLTIAFARHEKFKVWTVLDERSAGFFAYGMARTRHEPVVLVCTSGTATANFFPAVVEAFQSEVPLLVITADRPPELHGVGSNQTINQDQLYGTFVKQFISMPVPEDTDVLLRHARWTATRAVSLTTASPHGPVHINWPFREPLLPPPVAENESSNRQVVHVGTLQFSDAEVAALASSLQYMKKGLIVCGPQDREELAAPVLKLAETWQFPVLADPLSQLRTSGLTTPLLIDHYDAFLRAVMSYPEGHPVRQALQPEVVIRIGHVPTSKVLGQYLSSLKNVRQVVINGSEAWQDPFFTATEVWQADPVAMFGRLIEVAQRAQDSSYAMRWSQISATVQKALWQEVPKMVEFFEGRVWMELEHIAPEGSVLFAGNSMPVRDMDSFFASIDRKVRVVASRGASGIDGVVSSAFGVSAAVQAPVILVIGDLSFYHDLNGLMLAKLYDLSLIVILIQNDGGGIFSFLPQSTQKDVFDYFSTSHGLDFEEIVKSYNGSYQRITSWEHFQTELGQAIHRSGLQVLELKTDREENVAMHRQLFAACAHVLESLGDEWVERN